MKYQSRNLIITCAVAVAGGLFVASEVTAQAPAQIFACVNQNGGITIVAQNATCPQNATRLTWNAAGPQGPQGPAGPTGATGATGAQGPAGATAFSEYRCAVEQFDMPFARPIPFSFTGNTGGGGVGGNLGVAENFILQQGIYQVEFHAELFSSTPVTLIEALDYTPDPKQFQWEIAFWNATVGTLAPFQYHFTGLLKSGPNQVLSIRSGGSEQPVDIGRGSSICRLILTKLQ